MTVEVVQITWGQEGSRRPEDARLTWVKGLGWKGEGAQVGTRFLGILNVPLIRWLHRRSGSCYWSHCGEVMRCKGFFRKLCLGADAAYTEGHLLVRRPVRTCWNPDRI